MSKRLPFAAYRSQGYRVIHFHEVGGAQACCLTHPTKPTRYAARYRRRQADAATLAGAIALVRGRIAATKAKPCADCGGYVSPDEREYNHGLCSHCAINH